MTPLLPSPIAAGTSRERDREKRGGGIITIAQKRGDSKGGDEGKKKIGKK